MPHYRIEPIDISDSIWQDYNSDAIVIEADNEQQARFMAANQIAGDKLKDNRGKAMPLPPCLVKEQTRCICMD